MLANSSIFITSAGDNKHAKSPWISGEKYILFVWSSLIGWHQVHGVRSFSSWLCWQACCTELQENAMQENAVIKVKVVMSATIHLQIHLWTVATTNINSGECSTLWREHLQYLWLWCINSMIAVSQTKHGTANLHELWPKVFSLRWHHKCFPPCTWGSWALYKD